MRESPAAERNKTVIFEALNPLLPKSAQVLEVAAGSGQHAVYIAGKRPDLDWQPSDIAPEALQSIRAWIDHSGVSNVADPVTVDCLQEDTWPPADSLDAIVATNMIHISPWQASLGLLQLAENSLRPGGILFVYGPFFRKGLITAPSNSKFDEALRAENPEWGLRHLEVFLNAAETHGLIHKQTLEVPANNLIAILHKQSSQSS